MEQLGVKMGLTPLSERELMQRGGFNLRDLERIIRSIAEIIKVLEKYWAPYLERYLGFKREFQ